MTQRKRIVRLSGARAAAAHRSLSAKQAKQVKRIVNKSQELKQHVVWQDTTASSTMATTRLTTLGPGDGVDDRSGLKVIPRALEIDYTIQAADATNMVRVMVIRWKPNNGDDGPDYEEIFYTTAGVPLVSQVKPLSPLVFEKSQRLKFDVLYDRIHSVNTTDNIADMGKIRIYNSAKRTKMPPVFYDSDVLDNQKNGLYLITLSDSGAVIHPAVKYAGVLKFNAP